MKQIKLDYSRGTGFRPFFDDIRSIEVDDAPFAGGGFGDIYHALSFNGRQAPLRQVVKVFKPSTIGKDEHSWKTISRLQEKVIEEVRLFKCNQKDFLEEYPALIALPQFIFEGDLDGRHVRGYVTNNLNDLGYVSFDKVIDEDDSPYLDAFDCKDMPWRYTAAYHLVRGFNMLYKLHFLHADISSDNIFVHPDNPTCVILDFDSGAVVETLDDNPSTFGKFQPWLAPEINFQLKEGHKGDGSSLVEINVFTDQWSVANAVISVLLYLPAYYLKDLSENSLRRFANKYTWPRMDTSDPIFNSDNTEVYDFFLRCVDGLLANEVRKEFEMTFTQGIFRPSLRTSYNKWELILGSQIPKGNRKLHWSHDSSDKFFSPPMPTPSPLSPGRAKEELVTYLNNLAIDIVNGDEELSHHKHFVMDMATKAGMDGKVIINELSDFVDLVKDCVADKKITLFEKYNMLAQGELALIKPETIEKIIKRYNQV